MVDHAVRTRYVDAQTVSDEHGKGVESLRQAKADHWEPASAAGSVISNHHILDCEVDMIIRWIRVWTVDVPDANADVSINRNRGGTLTALVATQAIDGFTTEVSAEPALTVSAESLRRNDSVYAIMTRDATSTESADWAIFLGWMPDLGLGANDPRTF